MADCVRNRSRQASAMLSEMGEGNSSLAKLARSSSPYDDCIVVQPWVASRHTSNLTRGIRGGFQGSLSDPLLPSNPPSSNLSSLPSSSSAASSGASSFAVASSNTTSSSSRNSNKSSGR